MANIARKGDMAMILNAYIDKSAIGTVVQVLSDPEMHPGILADGTRTPIVWCNEIDMPANHGMHTNVWHNTAWLLPLRGNPDALTWTTETGRSVKA